MNAQYRQDPEQKLVAHPVAAPTPQVSVHRLAVGLPAAAVLLVVLLALLVS
jgi:hypothetical protein